MTRTDERRPGGNQGGDGDRGRWSGADDTALDDPELLAEVFRVAEPVVAVARRAHGGRLAGVGTAEWWAAPDDVKIAGVLVLGEAWCVHDPERAVRQRLREMAWNLSQAHDWGARSRRPITRNAGRSPCRARADGAHRQRGGRGALGAHGQRGRRDVSDPDRPQSPDLLAGMRNGSWLDAQRFPPLAYAVPGIVPEGFTLQVGAPKIGKSWCVLGYALAVASGGHALGAIPVDKRAVLLLALEDGHRRMQERCRSLLAGDPIPAGLDYLTDLHPGTVVTTIAEWMSRHPDDAPLVILDTLGKVMPPSIAGESAYGRDYRIGTSLKRLCDERPGSSLLVNHHDRKAEAADFVDSVSGTHGLAGAADTVVILSRERHEKTGLVMVTGRDVPEGEYAVKLADTGAWTLDGATLADAAAVAAQRRATAGVGDRSAEILGLVGQHPEGVRSAQVEREVGPDARRYLARLVDSGRLVRPRRGLYLLPTTPVPSVPTSQEQDDGMGQRDSRDSPLGEGTTHLRSVADREEPTP